MRWSRFILLQCLLIAIFGGIIYIHEDRVIVLKKPPLSLAKWYKPENKRHVWLHNMFKLRREMQAVKYYAAKNDAKHLEKWLALLREHYLEIAEMVPEWEKKLDMGTVTRLQALIKSNHFQDIPNALDDLRESCDSCHTDYRAITAVTYRAGDFSTIEVNPSIAVTTHMEELSEQINQIKIASEDGMKHRALSSLAELRVGINALGETCSNCHEKDALVYPGDTINKTIVSLEKNLKTGTTKDQGKDLGTLAVLACAKCHGTHRLAYDMRKIHLGTPNWSELIKH